MDAMKKTNESASISEVLLGDTLRVDIKRFPLSTRAGAALLISRSGVPKRVLRAAGVHGVRHNCTA